MGAAPSPRRRGTRLRGWFPTRSPSPPQSRSTGPDTDRGVGRGLPSIPPHFFLTVPEFGVGDPTAVVLNAEGVAFQSPGSRSAPWDPGSSCHPYAEGVASAARRSLDETPSGYGALDGVQSP